ncbi:MAG: xanthine dehydrogenase family protein molybdopterin-binding subunit, partial [Rhizobiales bacterium]|nr:xanthine dehydrogenase family protein molybdopterin-binding subunit [Hyphomicrobiales bacterium]
VIAKACALASNDFEADMGDVEFSNGELIVTGTDIRIRLGELAVLHPGELDSRQSAELKDWTYPNGCHIAEVEIDGDTGVARIVAYTIVDDFGRVVNPLLVEGQVIGGVVQGIGQALMEQARYDDTAQLISGSFADYCMARAGDLPSFAFSTVEIPSTNNAMGIKGCGEAGTIAAPPAVINALVDALWKGPGHTVPSIDMPATAEAIWASLGRLGRIAGH